MIVRFAALCLCLAVAAAPRSAPARTPPGTAVPDAIQEIITEHFRSTFILPDLVNWQFDEMHRYPVGGYAVCGTVDYPDSTRRYSGPVPFFGIVRDGVFQEGGIVTRNALQDPTQATRRAYSIACGG